MVDQNAPARGGVTDIHVHIQPFDEFSPGVEEALRGAGKEHFERVAAILSDPAVLLDELDRAGIYRIGMVNDVSPEVTGFTEKSNDFALRYAEHDRERLLPIAGIHALRTKDPAADVDRFVDDGFVAIKIHPPHQGYAANAYTEGLDALGAIYRRAEERELPVVVHTGTSVFPGARCKYGRPIDLDDVAIDFPGLTIVMAHAGRPIWYDEAFFLLRRHRNVWLDLSGIPIRKIPDVLPRLPEIGERVLWGSDWPGPGVAGFRDPIDKFLALPFPEEWKRAVTETNSRKLFP